MEFIKKELKIPNKYMVIDDGKICATVHKIWLSGFTNLAPVNFIYHNHFTPEEIAAQPSTEELGSNWTKVYIKIYEKRHKNACILPRERSMCDLKVEAALTFSEVLHYVAKTNYQNLWKHFYKKYCGPRTKLDLREQSNTIGFTSDVELTKEILNRMYGCTVIQLTENGTATVVASASNRTHCNLLPVMFVIETETAFIIFYEQTAKYSLRDYVMYSPAALSTNYAKPLFLTYQLIRLSRELHDRGLVLGEVTLNDILIMENLTIQVLPNIYDNLHFLPETPESLCKMSKPLQRAKSINTSTNISIICEMWVHGRLSNFDYLTALNNLAGRRYGDPSCHHVMPWVTDFTSRDGGNWRDFTKSKFRLNKGDRQLDLTFDSESAEVGYHVSDVLSEITYYVYLSRRYSRSILCKHVRPLWVPGEYPGSIQRLYDWSPDECIPQFFTDSSVFKSIHEDLPDLEIPGWAMSPEDFVYKHREALESTYVSERLHHWIDLTFGYKLSGLAAIKSKNVCLHLVDNHMNLSNSGVVQLFTQPHPQKIVPSPYWSKNPPRLRNFPVDEKILSGAEEVVEKAVELENRSSDDEESPAANVSGTIRSSPLAFSRFLSRSRSSLPLTDDGSKQDKIMDQTIFLPKDYNPALALIQVQTTHTFINKMTHKIYDPSTTWQNSVPNHKQIVASARMKEQQILGCLIVEIFLAEKFRAVWKTGKIPFGERLETCVNVIKTSPNTLPKCIRNVLMLLLKIDIMPNSYNVDVPEFSDADKSSGPAVTFMGLPPPSAHQILQPILSGFLFSSSQYMQHLYSVVEMIQEYNALCRDLDQVTQLADDGERTRIVFLCKINECKVKEIARELENLLSHSEIESETNLQLIVPYVKQIFEQPFSAVLAAWYLFDPIARALGPTGTANMFLVPIQNLYDKGSAIDKLSFANTLPVGLIAKFKTIRLYHRSFLLKLMVRLGLRRFLENFITPLVEAVGGYRNHLSGSLSTDPDKGNLKDCDFSENISDADAILSPLDEDSSVESEHNILDLNTSNADSGSKFDTSHEISNDAIFVMETDDSCSRSPSIDVAQSMNFDLNLDIDNLIEETSKYSLSTSAKSPTIHLSKSFEIGSGKSVPEFNTICCKVGSTTCSEDSPLASDSNAADDSTEQEYLTFGNIENEEDAEQHKQSEEIRKQKRLLTECTISEMSAESVIWLSHRLGPVLTARYLSRNLLKMLTLCYFGKENLAVQQVAADKTEDGESGKILGDSNAIKVLECLTSIVGLYGEQTIVVQYLSHMTELVAQCKRKLTLNLEGGLVSCLVLLIRIIPYLSDSSLMDVIHEVIVKSILQPIVRILSTTKYTFPNGAMARSVLADKYLEAMSILITRLGSVMATNQLSGPIQRFFLAFDKVFNVHRKSNASEVTSPSGESHSREENEEVADDGCTRELCQKPEIAIPDSFSPSTTDDIVDIHKYKALEELKVVFSTTLAHKAYTLFYRLLGSLVLDQILKNHHLIRMLYQDYAQEILSPSSSSNVSESKNSVDNYIKGFGKVSTIGNRINIEKEIANVEPSMELDSAVREASPFSMAGRQLRGNWLAYWEHEIGRPDKDHKFNIKQIKLQTFAGHTNSVRCLSVLDNENSFMSGGRDRTVKLWSLRSQGDGSTISSCQYTYAGHKKSILALTFLESLRYAVTCDGVIHCWDPFLGSLLGCPESPRPSPINVLAASPAPSTTILVATADITLRVVDCRTFQYVNEMKVSMNPTGLVRCIAVAPSGHWVALGQASGFLTILDIRTGLIIASWKGHECEVLQLQALNETTIISSSLDQTIAVWSAVDGKLKFHLKGGTEPIHCMECYEHQLILGTTANRIGVHSAIDGTTSCSFSKLSYDTFKGVLTVMAVLPLNRLLLLGADNGNINLIC